MGLVPYLKPYITPDLNSSQMGLRRTNCYHSPVYVIRSPVEEFEVKREFEGPKDDQLIQLSNVLDIRPSPGKGHGLFARCDIPAFTQILSEPALISIKEGEDLPQIWQQYESLPIDRQRLYKQLQREFKLDRDLIMGQKLRKRGYSDKQVPRMVHVAAIFQANAFNVEDFWARAPTAEDFQLATNDQEGTSLGGPIKRRALFPTIARLNHSCVCNAHDYFDPRTKSMDVRTVTLIPKDTEITIAYFSPLAPKSERRVRQSGWGFECDCAACSGPEPHGSTIERTRTRIRELDASTQNLTRSDEPGLKEQVALTQEMVDLSTLDSSLAGHLPDAYERLAEAQFAIFRSTDCQLTALERSRLKDAVRLNYSKAVEAKRRITGYNSHAAGEWQMIADLRTSMLETGDGMYGFDGAHFMKM